MWDRQSQRNVGPSRSCAECGTDGPEIMWDRRCGKNVGSSLPQKMLDRRGNQTSLPHLSTVPHSLPVRRSNIVELYVGPAPPRSGNVGPSALSHFASAPVPHFWPLRAAENAKCGTVAAGLSPDASEMWDRPCGAECWTVGSIGDGPTSKFACDGPTFPCPQCRSHVFFHQTGGPTFLRQGRSHISRSGAQNTRNVGPTFLVF